MDYIAHQAPLSMGFFRQEYWTGLPFSPPKDLPNPGIEPRSPALQADSLPSEPPFNSTVIKVLPQQILISIFAFQILKNTKENVMYNSSFHFLSQCF